MKDYRLSEIIEHCKRMAEGGRGQQDCYNCTEDNFELSTFCINNFNRCPLLWENLWENIEPLDIIELPCKIKVAYLGDVSAWQVVRRNKNGVVETVNEIFCTEEDADAFLANLKGEK